MEGIQNAKETTAMDLGALLDDGDDAVVTLVAGETRLVAHRAVLMDRSPVFNAMFRHDTLESRSGQVNIVDVEGPVLRQLLSHLYTLQAPQLPGIDTVTQLLAAADKYLVERLKAACEQQVAAQLSVETAAAAAVLAVRHSCESLKQASIAFLKNHTCQVMATRGWADAMHNHPDDMMEVNRLLAAETRHLPVEDKERRLRDAAMDGAVDELAALLAAGADVAATDGAWEKSSTMGAFQHAKETTALDLGALLDGCDNAVVTLVAGETHLVAHRAVLMDRSPLFAAMFAHDTLEASSGQVTIVDVEGPVLRQLVSYLYTLRAPQLPDIGMVTHLLLAALKYGVDRLKVACEQQVGAQLSVETAAAAAVLAVRHSCESLKQASITFRRKHTRQVMATTGWADAMLSQPDDMIEVNRLLVAEFRCLPAWQKEWRLINAGNQGTVGELEVLLAAGTDVAATDGDMMTALHYAAAGGHVEAVRLLLARGAEVDARTVGLWTPLHWAAWCGYAPVVRLLLAASADHRARTSNGWTPLHCAVQIGYAEVVAVLLEVGADRGARDDSGKTPLDVVGRRKNQLLLDLLAER